MCDEYNWQKVWLNVQKDRNTRLSYLMTTFKKLLILSFKTEQLVE